MLLTATSNIQVRRSVVQRMRQRRAWVHVSDHYRRPNILWRVVTRYTDMLDFQHKQDNDNVIKIDHKYTTEHIERLCESRVLVTFTKQMLYAMLRLGLKESLCRECRRYGAFVSDLTCRNFIRMYVSENRESPFMVKFNELAGEILKDGLKGDSNADTVLAELAEFPCMFFKFSIWAGPRDAIKI